MIVTASEFAESALRAGLISASAFDHCVNVCAQVAAGTPAAAMSAIVP
jgi:hypothetical protein